MERSRVIVIGESEANRGFHYPGNRLNTARYPNIFSLVTFGLTWLIFKSLSSCYFLLVSLFQFLTPFSPTGRFSTLLPYTSNKLVELYFLYLDNTKREKEDEKINERVVRVITTKGILIKNREDLKVGDVVVLEAEWRKEEVPADILLLYSPSRDVYVNMASLTGEKDPIQKHVPDRLHLRSPSDIPVCGILYTQPVSQDLDQFDGLLCFGTERYMCTADNVILAGSILLQGTDVYGVVFATHSETKLHMKNNLASHKVGILDKKLNLITGCTLFLLFAFILFMTVGNILYSDVYVDIYMILQIALSYFLLFNGLIAQTLHFTLDLVRRIQVKLSMSRNDIDVHNYSIIESLALLDCIVFDKTGTLTTNHLIPKKFSCIKERISKKSPSAVSLVANNSENEEFELENVDNRELDYVDYSTTHKLRMNDEVPPNLHRLMLGICLNNTVVRLANNKPDIVYFGTSTDEVVLMESIYSMSNYLLKARNSLENKQQLELWTRVDNDNLWELIHLFKYTSAKGKMTVIVRNVATNTVILITKGSPENMIPLLSDAHKPVAERSVVGLANEGFRVLTFAWKPLENWNENFEDYLESIKNDQILLDNFCLDLEKDMEFIGNTGTEDNLQPNLKETIRTLNDSGIKTFVCTGDIKLTAKNIGLNCGILPNDENLIFEITMNSIRHPLVEQLKNILDTIKTEVEDAKDGAKVQKKGILIGKLELPEILNHPESERMFKELIYSPYIQGIVVYRAGPSLKKLLADYLRSIDLIISCVGDGANDIEMIKSADIGIGIKAGENQHAAACSDIAIPSVTQLPSLLFHFGKLNWIRNTNLTLFISSMKLTIVLTLLFYDIYSGFKIESIFTGKMLLAFNVFYGWGVLFYGALFLVHGEQYSLAHPELYKSAPSTEIISIFNYFIWWLRAAFDSVLVLFISFFCLPSAYTEDTIVLLGDNIRLSRFAAFILIIIWINIKVSLVSGFRNWSSVKWIHAAVFLTLFSFLLTTVQSWHSLPALFWLEIFLATVFYVCYHYSLDTLTAKLFSPLPQNKFKID